MKLSREMFSVYGVTPNNPDAESIEKAINGGVKIIQLRMKNANRKEFLEMALKVKKICEGKALFIINDDVSIAAEIDADGVHLGQGDMKISDARKMLKNKIIGLSAHNREEAMQAEKDGADYIGCGAMFPTETKNDVIPLSLFELREICRVVTIPVVAIGGISLDNMSGLKDSGIDGIAVSSALFKGDAKEFVERWKSI
ncbi:MAG: thiamine phosphate synthase [Clostridia bacterium]|nr:thiamine phosphate synthase [Clostridia bacterium]